MNEDVSVDELAFNCSDFGELITKVEAAIHLGNKVYWFEVSYSDVSTCTQTVSLNSAFDLLGEEAALKHLASIKHGNTNDDFALALDEQVSNLAEQAARSYKGQHNV